MYQSIANQIFTAWKNRQTVDSISEALAVANQKDLPTARQVRDELVKLKSAENKITGYKIGVTNEAAQKAMGVDSPEYGILFEDIELYNNEALIDHCPKPYRLEPEIGFQFDKSLPLLSQEQWKSSSNTQLIEQLQRALKGYALATDIINSRVDAPLNIINAVSENLLAGHYQLGNIVSCDKNVDNWANIELRVQHNNKQIYGSLKASACLDNPINALLWLWQHLNLNNKTIKVNEVVLTGTLCPPIPLISGDNIEIFSDQLGELSLHVRSASVE